MHRNIAGLAAACLLVFAIPASAATPGAYQQGDFKGFSNILPPGNNGVDSAPEAATFGATGQRPANWTDQLAMYRDLLYASPGLKNEDISKYFKDASFGAKPEDVVRTYSPRDDVVTSATSSAFRTSGPTRGWARCSARATRRPRTGCS